MHILIKITATACALSLLSACGVAKTTAKIATLPVKATVKTGELAGQGVYYTGKGTGTAVYKTGEMSAKGAYYTGKGAYKTGELASKGVYYTGKGAYTVGTVPVTVMNNALDTTAKVLSVTTQIVDLSGKVVNVTRNVQRAEVDAYVNQARGAANVVGIIIDVMRR